MSRLYREAFQDELKPEFDLPKIAKSWTFSLLKTKTKQNNLFQDEMKSYQKRPIPNSNKSFTHIEHRTGGVSREGLVH